MRKPLGPNKRSIMLGVKVTPAMREKLEARAKSSGLTLSTYIVSVLNWYLGITEGFDHA